MYFYTVCTTPCTLNVDLSSSVGVIEIKYLSLLFSETVICKLKIMTVLRSICLHSYTADAITLSSIYSSNTLFFLEK